MSRQRNPQWQSRPRGRAKLVALCSDGLLLADRRDIDQGLTLLRTVLAGPACSLEQTRKAVEDAMLPDRLADDVTPLLGRTGVLAEEKVATWELLADATAAGRAGGGLVTDQRPSGGSRRWPSRRN
ncbi:hypothetical protein ACWDV7_33645 [Streptomyces sp. NPDC003362]